MRIFFANFIYAACLMCLIAAYALLPVEHVAHDMLRSVIARNGIYLQLTLTLVLVAQESVTKQSLISRLQNLLQVNSRQRDAAPAVTCGQ